MTPAPIRAYVCDACEALLSRPAKEGVCDACQCSQCGSVETCDCDYRAWRDTDSATEHLSRWGARS